MNSGRCHVHTLFYIQMWWLSCAFCGNMTGSDYLHVTRSDDTIDVMLKLFWSVSYLKVVFDHPGLRDTTCWEHRFILVSTYFPCSDARVFAFGLLWSTQMLNIDELEWTIYHQCKYTLGVSCLIMVKTCSHRCYFVSFLGQHFAPRKLMCRCPHLSACCKLKGAS